MKKLFPLLVMILTLYSCNKNGVSSISDKDSTNNSNLPDSTGNPNNNHDSTNNNHDCTDPSSSHWTFSGNTYCGVITTNDTTDFGVRKDYFKSSNGISDSIQIMFWSDPLVSAAFILNNGTLPTPQFGTCTIVVNHGDDLYVSTGGNGTDVVNVTVDGDSITASFSNIAIMKHDTSYAMSTLTGILTTH